ncbi:MAG: aminotransferase class III-fold pyridoxal phosphate-dependent enzyme, partial [Oligoflexales bacterium]|nr:aminotransferase class III-fold pyridoxal phosphate-dependent enzyme [Oligoflexales bacterium]
GNRLKVRLDMSKLNYFETADDFIGYLSSFDIRAVEDEGEEKGARLQKREEKGEAVKSLFEEYSRPVVSGLLGSLDLDKVYHRASGNDLYYFDREGAEIKVRDFVGGYGSVILGHNNPEIVETALSSLKSGLPVHSQLSIKRYGGELARALSEEIGKTTGKKYIVTLANTGTEAVEAAVKHCNMVYFKKVHEFQKQLETNLANISRSFDKCTIRHGGTEIVFDDFESFRKYAKELNEGILKNNKPGMLAAKKSFHGKTMGSLLLTFKEEYRIPFLGPDTHADFFSIDEDDLMRLTEGGLFNLFLPVLNEKGAVEFAEKQFNRYTALFLEPVQGEGGVHIISDSFIRFAREITRRHGIGLVFDEIQAGFYRTGRFLASSGSGVEGDYYILGKSLGGGLSKISAMIVDRDLYEDEFGLLHTSTYAEDELSSRISLRALELTRSKLPIIMEKARYLDMILEKIQRSYPKVVKEVRGVGLMRAVEFRGFEFARSGAFQLLHRSGFFNYLVAGYLLRKYNIRVAAPLSTSFTVRIQPSMEVSVEDMDLLYDAFRDVCSMLEREDLYRFIENLLPERFKSRDTACDDYSQGTIVNEEPEEEAYKIGFLVHYADKLVRLSEPSLFHLDDDTAQDLLKELLHISKPIVALRKNIRDIQGNKIHVTFIGLPFTPHMYKEALKEAAVEAYEDLCHEGIRMLKEDFGARIVGLGQYTSIITANGTNVPSSDIAITTGNAYTAWSSIEAVLESAREKGIDLENECIGFIGACGNINSVIAEYMTRHARNIKLLGSSSPSGYKKAVALSDRIRSGYAKERGVGGLNIRAVTDISEIKDCKVVFVATNEPEPFLTSDHFSQGAIVCDISVPVNCTKELLLNKKDIKVIKGGVIALPGGEEIMINGYPLK